MKFPRVRRVVLPLAFGLLLAGGGCSGVFTPKFKVLVDSIASPEVTKPAGQSYRLVAKPSVVNQTPVQVPVIAACVTAALNGAGLFEAPATVASDIVIELSFGTESAPRVEAAARETYLEMSARTNPERSLEKATGPEVWNVRVAVLGVDPGSRLEAAMPLLASVAAGYLASDTHIETEIEIPQNSPSITSIRETAIKTLEAKYPTNANAAKTNAPQGTPIPAVLPAPLK